MMFYLSCAMYKLSLPRCRIHGMYFDKLRRLYASKPTVMAAINWTLFSNNLFRLLVALILMRRARKYFTTTVHKQPFKLA